MAPLLFCTISMLLAPASSPAGETPTLTVVWNDFYGLFPGNAVVLLGDELHRLFQTNGMSVRLHRPSIGENLLLIREPRVNAVVTGADGSRFGLGRDTMAAIVGSETSDSTSSSSFPRCAEPWATERIRLRVAPGT